MRPFVVAALASAVAITVGACAHVDDAARVSPVDVGPSAAHPHVDEPATDAIVLTRAMARSVASRGAGPVLRELEFAERPVFRDGRFVGLRLLARHDRPFTRALIDARPGDVITLVNGVAPRTPDDVMAIVRGLASASSLTIALLRDGKPLTLEIPIVDRAGETVSDTLQKR